MTELVGERVLWIIPLESILDDVEPVDTLCKTFHFTARKLVESLVHEWFRYRLGNGPYQLGQIFNLNRQTAIEQIKGAFLSPDDTLVHKAGTDDIERVIDLTGHAVFDAVSHYVQSFGVPIETISGMEIVGWCYKALVVRFI